VGCTMTRAPSGAARHMRTGLPLLLLVGLAAVAIALPAGGAAATTDTWRAKVGASGANGTATVTATGSSGTLKLALKSLTASTAYPVKIQKGTCAAPGSTLWAAPTQRSTSAGKIAKSLAVPAAKLTAIRAASAAGPIAIRVGTGSKLRCGPFTGGPAPSPTPTPTPSASASPSPSAGGTAYYGPYYSFSLPAGWSLVPPPSATKVTFRGPGDQQVIVLSVPTDLTAEAVDAQIIATLKGQTGADPERTEAIILDGAPGQMLTYHFSSGGTKMHYLEAHCLHTGRLYEINFVNRAGTEDADRALFLAVVASFRFRSGF
jgi:hypothetical protein